MGSLLLFVAKSGLLALLGGVALLGLLQLGIGVVCTVGACGCALCRMLRRESKEHASPLV